MPNPKPPTRKEIEKRLELIVADERFHYPAATVFENAALALIQTELDAKARILAWVLNVDPPQKRKKVRNV